MPVNTTGGISGAARCTTSVTGPGASASSGQGTTETAVTATFLGDVEGVLKADEGEECEHGALHQDQSFALFARGRRHLQIIDAPPIGEADRDDENEPG